MRGNLSDFVVDDVEDEEIEAEPALRGGGFLLRGMTGTGIFSSCVCSACFSSFLRYHSSRARWLKKNGAFCAFCAVISGADAAATERRRCMFTVLSSTGIGPSEAGLLGPLSEATSFDETCRSFERVLDLGSEFCDCGRWYGSISRKEWFVAALCGYANEFVE